MENKILTKLPTKYGIGANKDKIVVDWNKIIEYKIRFIYDDLEYEFDKVNYNSKTRKLKILYKDKEYEITDGKFKSCSFGGIIGKYTSEFKVKIGTHYKDEKRDIIITDRKKEKDKCGVERKYYQYYCNKCGFNCGQHYKNGELQEEYWISESGLLNGNRCGCCNNASQIVVEGINDIATTNPYMLICFKDKKDGIRYSSGADTKVKVICPDCGKEKYIAINKLRERKTISCSCGDGQSFPNKLMNNILIQLNINFETEYNPEWIKPKRYDFYIQSMNNIIEMDGGLGHGKDTIDNKLNAKETLEIDRYKDEQAKLHNIEVIRINCDYKDNDRFEYIKQNILNNNDLKESFDFSNVDWLKAEEYALSNLVKKVCELWNNKKENETTIDIANIIGYRRTTIIYYLKKGNKHGWCNYDSKEELKRNYGQQKYRNQKIHSKEVEIFKEGNSLGVFKSLTELSRRSEELFGIHLSSNYISLVCTGKRKEYKNFTFKHKLKQTN